MRVGCVRRCFRVLAKPIVTTTIRSTLAAAARSNNDTGHGPWRICDSIPTGPKVNPDRTIFPHGWNRTWTCRHERLSDPIDINTTMMHDVNGASSRRRRLGPLPCGSDATLMSSYIYRLTESSPALRVATVRAGDSGMIMMNTGDNDPY